jgi:hypothetical protein
MTWSTWLAVLAAVLLLAAGLTALGARRWAAVTQPLADSLAAGRVPPADAVPARYDSSEIEHLPPPVRRYFRAALKPGQAIIRRAEIAMTGRFNMSSTGEQWKPFTSAQQVTTRRPGFIWDASISVLPGLKVRVVDSYIAGNGLLKASIQGLYTVADLQGGDEIARGEFMRWFAEAVWYPTALLPSQGVRWRAVDARSADATLDDGQCSLCLRFHFDDAGLISSFRAASRGGMVGKAMVQAPWEGRFSDYQSHDGMLVPFAGEVAWMRPEGRKTYFRGVVTQLRYMFSP